MWRLDVLTAISTCIIAAFTIVLAAVSWRQARLTRAAIKLAREEFVATHRPVLKVRAMENNLPVPGKPYLGAVIISNVGVSPAILTEIRTDTGRRKEQTQWDTDGPWFSPKPTLTVVELPTDCRVPGGTAKSVLVRGHSPLDALAMSASEIDKNFPPLRLIGEIVYRDSTNIRRRVGFQFYWNAMGGQWQKPAEREEEFEYED